MSAIPFSKVAVLGLGIVGSRACQRLVDAGWNVSCWNRTPKGLPCEAESPAEAIKGAEVVSLYLKDAPAIREVMSRVVTKLEPGQILLNHSTIDLETTRWLEETCLSRGCRFLDAPFTGSKVAAQNGQLVYYIGGDETLASELEAFLTITSKARLYCGPVGAATVIKLTTNLISACYVQAMSEALAITTSHGVPAERLIEAVSQNASGSVLASMKFPTMVSGDYETHFSLDNMAKDCRYMLDLAASSDLETPAISAVSKRLEQLRANGLGELDYSALAKPYLQET